MIKLLTNLDLSKYRIYQDTTTQNFLAFTHREGDWIQFAKAVQTTPEHPDQPAFLEAVAEGQFMVFDHKAGAYGISDGAMYNFLIQNLERHFVQFITAHSSMAH